MNDLIQYIPDLQRFYGGDQLRWFQMPVWVFQEYWNAIERIQAQEAFRQTQIIAIAIGTLDSITRRQILQEWIRHIPKSFKEKQPIKREEFEARTRFYGFTIEHV